MSTQTLREKLDDLHSDYVGRINRAVAADDDIQVDRLATMYDDEATWMVAEHEGRTDLLPLRRPRRAWWLRAG